MGVVKFELAGEFFGEPAIVGIEKGDPFPGSSGGSSISGSGWAQIFVVPQPDDFL